MDKRELTTAIREMRISINYNSFLSQINFDDNFVRGKKSDYWIYTNCNSLSGDYCQSGYFTILPHQIKKLKKLLIVLTDGYYSHTGLINYTQYQLTELIFDEELSNNELQEMFDDFKINYEINYEVVKIYGYSQGDYAKILVNTKEFKKVTGSEFDIKTYKKLFHNYFFDSPLECRVNFTGEEYVYENYDSCYISFKEYDSDCVIEYFYKAIIENNLKFDKVDKEMFLKELKQKIPTEPEYL